MLLVRKTEFQKMHDIYISESSYLDIGVKLKKLQSLYSNERILDYFLFSIDKYFIFNKESILNLSSILLMPRDFIIQKGFYILNYFENNEFTNWFYNNINNNDSIEFMVNYWTNYVNHYIKENNMVALLNFVNFNFSYKRFEDVKQIKTNNILEELILQNSSNNMQNSCANIFNYLVESLSNGYNISKAQMIFKLVTIIKHDYMYLIEDNLYYIITKKCLVFSEDDYENENLQNKFNDNQILNEIATYAYSHYTESFQLKLLNYLNQEVNSRSQEIFWLFANKFFTKKYSNLINVPIFIEYTLGAHGIDSSLDLLIELEKFGINIDKYKEEFVQDITILISKIHSISVLSLQMIANERVLEYYQNEIVNNHTKYNDVLIKLNDIILNTKLTNTLREANREIYVQEKYIYIIFPVLMNIFSLLCYENKVAYSSVKKFIKNLNNSIFLESLMKSLPKVDMYIEECASVHIKNLSIEIELDSNNLADDIILVLMNFLTLKNNYELLTQIQNYKIPKIEQKIIEIVVKSNR